MPPTHASRRLRVLAADDDPAIAAILRRLLPAGSVVVENPGSTDALVAAAGRDAVDLVLLDMHMPGVDPANAVGRLARSNPFAAVLLMTGAPDADLLARCRALGALGPLAKPFRPDDLPAWLARFEAAAFPRPGASRLLLIEDELDQLADSWEALAKLGCLVTPTASAEAALLLLERRRFDLILTDNVLPGMTALEALPLLRGARAPIVVMSRQHGPDLEKDARLLGAAACVAKPLAAESFEPILRRVRGLSAD